MGIEEEEDKKEEKAKPKQGPFDDTMWRKLELDPTTKEYLFDNSFVEKMKKLQENPDLLHPYQQERDPKIMQALGVIMGMGPNINFSNGPPGFFPFGGPSDSGGPGGFFPFRGPSGSHPPPGFFPFGGNTAGFSSGFGNDSRNDDTMNTDTTSSNDEGSSSEKKTESETGTAEDKQPEDKQSTNTGDDEDVEYIKPQKSSQMRGIHVPPGTTSAQMGFAKLPDDWDKHQIEKLAKSWIKLVESARMPCKVQPIPEQHKILIVATGGWEDMYQVKDFVLQQPHVEEFEWNNQKFLSTKKTIFG